jgi:uncharacterized membrane protein (DUF2068 family)
MTDRDRGSAVLILIGAFKLLKALLLLGVALGVHHLLHRDVEEVVLHWARAVRVDPDNRYLHAALARITGLSPRKLHEIGLVLELYAALYALEGVGLVLRKRWGEYVAVITTAGLLPLEMYEVAHHFGWAKLIVLVLNAAVVVYLIVRLRRKPVAKEAG